MDKIFAITVPSPNFPSASTPPREIVCTSTMIIVQWFAGRHCFYDANYIFRKGETKFYIDKKSYQVPFSR